MFAFEHDLELALESKLGSELKTGRVPLPAIIAAMVDNGTHGSDNQDRIKIKKKAGIKRRA